jgi:hypothetical protein
MSTAVLPHERKVLDWLASQGTAMQNLLETLVNIDSGSHNKAGVDRVGAAIRDFLDSRGIRYDVIANDRFGNTIRLTVGAPGARNILLMGHRDTVYPDGETGRRPFRSDGLRGFGPGVADMKAGLVMDCFVAAAFKALGGAPAPVVALFTADEEIGSPSSRAIIEQEARRAALVFERRAGPTGRFRGHRPQGRYLHALRSRRQGGPCRRQFRARGERHCGNGAQDYCPARADRSKQRDHRQCRRRCRRADGKHDRTLGARRDGPPVQPACRSQRHDGKDKSHHSAFDHSRHQRERRNLC